MIDLVQQFMNRVSNLLFGDYLNNQKKTYEELSKFMGPDEKELDDAEEIHSVTPAQLRKIKRNAFVKALQSGIASLHIDPRVKGTHVPDKYCNVHELVLNYSYNYHIADFDFNDEYVIASLSFDRVLFQCIIPWDAVMGIGNNSEGCHYSFVACPLDTPDGKRSLHGLPGRQQKNITSEMPEMQNDSVQERRKKFKLIIGGKA